MRDITTIPTEIWDCIITGACTDGGYTGRSLALANKFFHSQSISNRLPSLRLTSLANVEKFLSFLDTQNIECKPKILHLFLAFLDKTEPIGSTSLDYSRGPTSTTKSAIREWNGRFVRSMTRLFSLAAPTLRTLCVVAEKPPIRLPAFPYGPLPVLEKLSVHQSLDNFFPGPRARKKKWNSNFEFQLPALQRLHAIYDLWADPDDSPRIIPSLVQYKLPNLTHVRISELGLPDYDFPRDLGTAMGVPYVRHRGIYWRPAVEPASSSQAVPLPNLRSVVVHTSSPQNTERRKSSYWINLCDQVQTAIPRLVKQVRDIDVSVVALSRPEQRKGYWHERLFDDWVSRIEGGTGCWVESEDEEAKLEVVNWPLLDDDDDDL